MLYLTYSLQLVYVILVLVDRIDTQVFIVACLGILVLALALQIC
jgi:hypothetical protein